MVQFEPKVKVAELPNTVSYRLRPMGRDKILVRFTNLADRFDQETTKLLHINIEDFA